MEDDWAYRNKFRNRHLLPAVLSLARNVLNREDVTVEPCRFQGYASFTCFASAASDKSTTVVVQVTPNRVNVAGFIHARAILGPLVPTIREVSHNEDLWGYVMEHLPGTPGGVADLKGDLQKRTMLAEGIGKAIGALIQHAPGGLDDGSDCISSITELCNDVARAQPDLAPKLDKLCERISSLEQVPKCITHGDLTKSNFLVDETSGKLTGIVDWGSAILAPCGLDMTVLFHLFDKDWSPSGLSAGDEAVEKAFWSAFLSEAPDMQGQIRSLALYMQLNGAHMFASGVMRDDAYDLRRMNAILAWVPFPLRGGDMIWRDNAAVGVGS